MGHFSSKKWVKIQSKRTALKEAVESTGQEWKGIHSLRYDAIQEQHTNGMSLSEISLYAGHSREEIILHYMDK